MSCVEGLGASLERDLGHLLRQPTVRALLVLLHLYKFQLRLLLLAVVRLVKQLMVLHFVGGDQAANTLRQLWVLPTHIAQVQ